jgi:RimJ/RimL family protein N-acetyltransferase
MIMRVFDAKNRDLMQEVAMVYNFMSEADGALEHFRYYKKRSDWTNWLEKHLCTIFVVDGTNEVVAYGHIDVEDGTHWLGMAVIEKMWKKGLGTIVARKLVEYCDQRVVPEIHLTVDVDNLPAQRIYEALGFDVERVATVIYMKRTLNVPTKA